MDCKKIGEYIQTKRKEAGLTQEQLGEMLGITSKAVSKWECGVAIPDVSLFSELANILHIEISELLNGEDNIKIPEDKKKNKIIIILVIIISLLVISIIALGIYFKSNYSKVKVYDLVSATESFNVEGKLISIGDKNYLTISKVDYLGKDADDLMYIYDYEYDLYYDEKLMLEYKDVRSNGVRDLVQQTSLKKIFSSISIFYDNKDNKISFYNINSDSYFHLYISVLNEKFKLKNIDVVLKVNN